MDRRLPPQSRGWAEIDAASPISDRAAMQGFDLTEDNFVQEVWGRFRASYAESIDDRTREWVLNARFLDGEQHIVWNEYLGEAVPEQAPLEHPYTENILIGMLAQQVAGMVQSEPSYKVTLANLNYESMVGARMALKYLLWLRQNENLSLTAYESSIYSLVCGFGVEHERWNPDAGPLSLEYALPGEDENDEPEEDEGEEPIGSGSEEEPKPRKKNEKDRIKLEPGQLKVAGRKGALQIDCMPSWNFYPQIGLTEPSLRRASYCVTAQLASQESVRRIARLPNDFKFDFSPAEGYRFYAGRGVFGTPRLPIEYTGAGARDARIPILTYYEKPAPVKGYELGTVLMIGGTKVLGRWKLQGVTPELVRKREVGLPFQIFPWTSRVSSFYPRPWFSDLREPQMRINQAVTHEAAVANITCLPNLLTTMGDGIPDDIPLGLEKLDTAPGFDKPRWMESPRVPQEIFGLHEKAVQAIRRVSSTSPYSSGEPVANTPSARLATDAAERDARDRIPILRLHARAREEQARVILEIARENEDEETLRDIVGEDGEAEAVVFKRDSLPLDYGIRIEPSSITPYLSASRQAAVGELIGMTLFGPPGSIPEDRAAALRAYINLPALDELPDPDRKQRAWTKRQVDRLVFGEEAEKRLVPKPALRWDASFILEQLRQRLLESDVDYWPEEVAKLVDAWFAAVEEVANAQREQAKQQALKDMQMQMAPQTESKQAIENTRGEVKAKVIAVKVQAESTGQATLQGAFPEAPAG